MIDQSKEKNNEIEKEFNKSMEKNQIKEDKERKSEVEKRTERGILNAKMKKGSPREETEWKNDWIDR